MRLRLRLPPVAAVLAIALVPSGVARSETVQHGKLRVAFEGELAPKTLPRSGLAPISVALGGRISTVDGTAAPQLQRISIAINRYGRLAPRALPACRVGRIQPATTANALAACGRSLVGRGSFSVDVLLPEQTPFPSRGRVLAFNGVHGGRPAVLAHVYGTDPAPTSYTLPFEIRRTGGTFGTVLSTSLPDVTSEWGHVTGLRLILDRIVSSPGRTPYLGASCPAPAGFPGAVFPLARTSFAFEGRVVSSTLERSCRVR